ncbi:heparin lyase I family protein [Roseinatronobacter sp. NSM]|uniref:heparin lyase I family protein n=1 Tax=Roseinatronobacter sp. NSM TaxID=3457785 RepID=UPI0040357D11
MLWLFWYREFSLVSVGGHRMRLVILICLTLTLLPSIAGAQAGLGSFDFIGKRENRPAVQSGFAHPNGAQVTCFSLPGSSCHGVDCQTDRERAQLIQRTPDNLEGEAYRYSLSFFLPSDFVDVRPANLMIWEVKPAGTGKPSAVVEVIDGHLQFSLSNPGVTQADLMNPERPLIIRRLGAIPKGQWTDIVVDARWSHGADGVLHVYQNGRRVVEHRGANIDAKSARQQVMYGLYRSFISRYLNAKGVSQMPMQQACFANVSRQRIQF